MSSPHSASYLYSKYQQFKERREIKKFIKIKGNNSITRAISEPVATVKLKNNNNCSVNNAASIPPVVLGTIKLTILSGVNVGKSKQKSYLVTYCNQLTQYKSATVVGSNPVYNNYIVCGDLFDVSDTLAIELYHHHVIQADEAIGQALIPLANILHSSKTNYSSDNSYSLHAWIPFSPFPDRAIARDTSNFYHQLPFAEDGIPHTGLKQKKFKYFGAYIQLKIEIKLFQPLSAAYFINSSLRSSNSSPMPLEPTKFHKSTVKRNLRRIRRQLKIQPLWMITVKALLNWEYNDLIQGLFVFVCYLLCFVVPSYSYPVLLVLIMIMFGLLSYGHNSIDVNHGERVVEGLVNCTNHIKSWEELSERYEWAGEGVIHKVNRYKGILAQVGYYAGNAATVLEKLQFALNFADFYLSMSCYAVLLAASCCISCALYSIPTHLWISFFIAAKLIKAKYKRITGQNIREEKEFNPFLPQLHAFIANVQHLINRILREYLPNLMSHFPDEYEYAHRLLCSRGIIYAENNNTDIPPIINTELLLSSPTDSPLLSPNLSPALVNSLSSPPSKSSTHNPSNDNSSTDDD
jgi:hypothetical protein